MGSAPDMVRLANVMLAWFAWNEDQIKEEQE